MATSNRQNVRTHLKPKEVCERLGVGIETVLNWIHSEKLKASNIAEGSRPRWVIAEKDLEAFLDSRSNQQKKPPQRAPKRRSRSARVYV